MTGTILPDDLGAALDRLSKYITTIDAFNQCCPVGVSLFANGRMAVSHSEESLHMVENSKEAAKYINGYLNEKEAPF